MSDASSTTEIEKTPYSIAIPGYFVTPATPTYPITVLTSREIHHSIDGSAIGYRLPIDADPNQNVGLEIRQ